PDSRVLGSVRRAGQVKATAQQVLPLARGDRPPDGARAQRARWQVEWFFSQRLAGLRAAPGEGGHLPYHVDLAEAHGPRPPVTTLQFADHVDPADLARAGRVAGVARRRQPDSF